MNSFASHHSKSIRFGYSCFDRIILQGMIPMFQHSKQGGTIVWFLRTHRQTEYPSRAYFARLANDYRDWVVGHSLKSGIPIIEPDKDCRREEWVEPYYQQLKGQPGIAVILKCRESERIAVYLEKTHRLAVDQRCVNHYYFYVNDAQCGRMWLRICPYFPFNIRVWMNGHNWLACRLRQEGIAFEQRDNLFVDCANPERLQQLADAFSAEDIRSRVESWLAGLIPFFSDSEQQQGYRHRLYMAQMEYCNNLLFHQKDCLERLFDRLMDANRTMGHPDKLRIVFARPHFQPDTRTGEILLKITKRRTPVITSLFKQTSVKQYVSQSVGLRTESTSYQLRDLSIKKNIDNLPAARQILGTANERYLEVQQDVLGSYIDRGQLQQLRRPTVSPEGRRVPGMRVDDPRLMAVLQAIICFAYLTGRGRFRTKELLPDIHKATGNLECKLSQLRYDLGKLRGKGLLVRQPGTQWYQVTCDGYRLAILYLKLYQRIYAPLTAGICAPDRADNLVLSQRRTKLDRLYAAVDDALQKLADHVGLAA
jgi:hypothetical protein